MLESSTPIPTGSIGTSLPTPPTSSPHSINSYGNHPSKATAGCGGSSRRPSGPLELRCTYACASLRALLCCGTPTPYSWHSCCQSSRHCIPPRNCPALSLAPIRLNMAALTHTAILHQTRLRGVRLCWTPACGWDRRVGVSCRFPTVRPHSERFAKRYIWVNQKLHRQSQDGL